MLFSPSSAWKNVESFLFHIYWFLKKQYPSFLFFFPPVNFSCASFWLSVDKEPTNKDFLYAKKQLSGIFLCCCLEEAPLARTGRLRGISVSGKRQRWTKTKQKTEEKKRGGIKKKKKKKKGGGGGGLAEGGIDGLNAQTCTSAHRHLCAFRSTKHVLLVKLRAHTYRRSNTPTRTLHAR